MRYYQLPKTESLGAFFFQYGSVVEVLLHSPSKNTLKKKYTALLRVIYLISDTTFKITFYFCLFFFRKAGKCCN